MKTRLYRSANGVTIHAEGCRFALPTGHWVWADDKTRTQVAAMVIKHDYQACPVCKPLGGTR